MSQSAKMWKYDIVHLLSDANGYKSYLEICTPTSGRKYAEIDQTKYDYCHRLMYRCPDEFDDGLAINFRSQTNNLKECIQEIRSKSLKYDIVFVDAFHSYEASMRDLKLAFSLLKLGGSIVVHDCLPPKHASVSPTFVRTCWGGVTFRAFIDFVLEHIALKYFTVDTDWGCGVIQHASAAPSLTTPPLPATIEQWASLGADSQQAFEYLHSNAQELLNLMSPDAFISRLNITSNR